jgi:hypothetical protein
MSKQESVTTITSCRRPFGTRPDPFQLPLPPHPSHLRLSTTRWTRKFDGRTRNMAGAQPYMVLCGRYMSLWPLWPLWTTVDLYGIYVALPQGLVDGPGIADAGRRDNVVNILNR